MPYRGGSPSGRVNLRHALTVAPAAALLTIALGCVPSEPTPDWWDQLEPDSVCYQVDLLDGLDESSTTELHDLFDCINYRGHLDPLVPASVAFDAPTRSGSPTGIELAALVNDLPELDIDPLGLAGAAAEALQSDDQPVREVLDLFLELVYGTRATKVRGGAIDLDDPGALEAGIVHAAKPLVPVLTDLLLAEGSGYGETTAELLVDPELHRWLRSVASLAGSQHPTLVEPMDHLVEHLGDALGARHDTGNDHWWGASGDSLRDLVDIFLLGNDPLLDELAPEAIAVFGDHLVRVDLQNQVSEWHDEGHLQELIPQLAWIASVDPEGGPLDQDEISALSALVRLLHDTNQPMVCSFDLWVTDLEVDLGNLAIAILEILADQDPTLVRDGVGLLGDLLGWDLSALILDEVAESGVCSALTPQVVDDLGALDVIYEPEAYDLLVVFIDLLAVLKYGEENRIPEMVELAADLHATAALDPVEEVLRDLGDEPLVDDLVAMLPAILEPEAYGITAGEQPPIDFQDLLSALLWALEPGDDGRTGWQRLEPFATPLLTDDATWTVLDRLGSLLAEGTSQTAQILDLVARVLPEDIDLALLDDVALLVGDERVSGPALRLLESELLTELLATNPTGQDARVPLAWVVELVLSGILEDLLELVDLMLTSFGELLGGTETTDSGA